MRRITRNADNIFWAAVSLFVMLIVLAFMLRLVARYAPSPVSDLARQGAQYADLGNV